MIKFEDRKIQRTVSIDMLPQFKKEINNVQVEFQSNSQNFSDQDYLDDLQILRQYPPGVSMKINLGTPKLETPSKLPYIIDESKQRYKGKMKFYDETKKYGFLILDGDNTDVFVHLDDLQIAGIKIEALRQYKQIRQENPNYIKFQKNGAPYLEFTLMNYMGKYNKSRKAIELQLIS